MMDRARRFINLTLAIAVLTGGGGVCVWLAYSKPAPPRRDTFARTTDVVVLPVVARAYQSPVIGYGTVRPHKQVNITPLVNGRLAYAHGDLAPGKVIPKGELLFEIDPVVYQSRVAQADAEVRRLEATLARLDQEIANLGAHIVNAKEILALEEKDYLTSRRLYEDEHVGTERELDLVWQKYLRQKDAFDELASKRSVIPLTKLEAEAELDGARARRRHAQYELEGTRIGCPFKARIEAVHAQASQVVTAFLSIATLTDMGAFEIPVGIDPRELQWLDAAAQPTALRDAEADGAAAVVTVRWSLHGQQFYWNGHVSRFERVDERTRTVQLVVEVREGDMTARADAASGALGLDLSIGMFCRAELPGRSLGNALLIPRHAVHDNRWVYVFEPDSADGSSELGRLGRREVPVLRAVGDWVLVDYAGRQGIEVCELSAGEQLVVSPLAKPVVGMAVRGWAEEQEVPVQDSLRRAERFDEEAQVLRLGAIPPPRWLRPPWGDG